MKKDRNQAVDRREVLISLASMVLSVALLLMMLWGAGELISEFAGHWIDKEMIEYTGGSL